MMTRNSSELIQFVNCKILKNHKIIKEDLWVREGKIINPEKVFFDEKIQADRQIDCKGQTIAPGFIDVQINGGFGIDFSYNQHNVKEGVNLVAKGLLAHGVTSFCPTLVTSHPDTYHLVLPQIQPTQGGSHGAGVLGIHLEGPFINMEKKGAHKPEFIRDFDKGFESVLETYGKDLSNIIIVTLAPEKENSSEVIRKLKEKNIIVSVGHSTGDLSEGEKAVQTGATLITHLFNAMLPFHHRDPGLVGLLTSSAIPEGTTVYFGIIADGVHTNPAALRIAYKVHPEGLVVVTDAVSALGLQEGEHHIGEISIEIKNSKAYISGTDTLCGSMANMNECVKIFLEATNCTVEYALEAASLHPALALGLEKKKGTLHFGADADFILLDSKLDVQSTWIAGECVYKR